MTEETALRLTEAVDRLNRAERAFDTPNIRPKDAATLLILDRTPGAAPRVLMGRRHMRHKFFPGAYVFPGGRVDAGDHRVPLAGGWDPITAGKLAHGLKGRASARRLAAFGVAAIRETYEEAGLFIGAKGGPVGKLPGDFAAFAERGVAPALGSLRFVARAITPPRRPRRFDTRFFACFAEDVADRLADGVGPSGELEDVAWLTFEEARKTEIPPITVTILDEIRDRLARDPRLAPEAPVPYYYWLGKGFRRETI